MEGRARAKVAMVTGASGGIGASICHALARRGYKVVACDRKRVSGEGLASLLNKAYGASTAVFLECDVTREESLRGSIEAASGLGLLQLCVLNAGVVDDSPPAWRKSLDLNLTSVAATSLRLLGLCPRGPPLLVGSSPALVFISSLGGLHRDPLYPLYAAAKGALNVLATSLGSRPVTEETGVRVLSLCPGLTDTEMAAGLSAASSPLPPRVAEKLLRSRLRLPKQRPESVADCLCRALETGDSGSIWIVENDAFRQVDFGLLLRA